MKALEDKSQAAMVSKGRVGLRAQRVGKRGAFKDSGIAS